MTRSKRRPSKAPDGNDTSPQPPKKIKKDDDDDDNDDNETSMTTSAVSPAPPLDDAAAAPSDDDDDDDDENDTPSSASRRISTPIKSVNPAGRPAEAGIIKEVYVENFMCHRKLTVKLCRNVNFIYGQNGSGKSAVLAAIQICLGAGAKRTHRARNTKELIRKEAGSDCSGAKVRVTLLNRGDDGYLPDVYGDEITVERCISRTGYNGYKLLDKNKKKISDAKKDLDAMLDQLNIQVENPVAVLDQEDAKKFLSGKAEDKYKFFCKATELERIDRSYAAVVDNVTDLEDTKERVRSSLKSAMDNVKRLEQEWKESQELEKLEEKVGDQKIMYAWSCYNVLKHKVAGMESIVTELDNKRIKRAGEVTKAEESTHVNREEEETLKDQLKELTTEAQTAATHKTTLESTLRSALSPVKHSERELSALQREILGTQRRHAAAVKHLQKARAEIMAKAGSKESEERKRLETIGRLERELVEQKELLVRQKEEISSLLKQYEDLEPNVEQAKSDTASVSSQHHAVNRKLQDLESSSGNSLAVFGQKCSIMAKKVGDAKKRHRFKGPVVGPIGAHIKIAPGKEEYATIAEHAMGGGCLDRFIVTNDADRQLYMSLRRDAGCSSRDCGVFQITSGSRYNVPAPPSADIETVESVLHVPDDLVYNCLVDNLKIDLKALARSKEESERALLIRGEDGKESVRGGRIQQAFFMPQGDFWQLRGGYRTMISNDSSHQLRQTIGVDRSAAIASTRRELDLLKRELQENKERERRILEQAKGVKLRWNNQNKSSRQTVKTIEKIENELTTARNEADANAAGNIEIDTTEMEEDVTKEEQTLAELKDKQQTLKQDIDRLMPAVDEAKLKLEEVTIRNEKVISDITKAEQKLEQYVKGQAHRQAVLDKKRLKLEQIEKELDQQRTAVADVVEKKNDAMEKARLLTFHREREKQQAATSPTDPTIPTSSPPPPPPAQSVDTSSIQPIPTPKEPNFYKAKIESLNKQIARERDRRRISERDPATLLQKYLRAKSALDSKYTTIDHIDKNIEKLIHDIKDRKKRYKQFRKHIADMTDTTFDEILNKKGSSGQLDFNHQDMTLNLMVQKDNTNEMSQTKDVKALSGGEKSYTTLSLLLALGENLETPFRVMDEFDVFLDPVSRKIALDTMVTVAKEMEHRQFIFITPQDLSSLKPDHMLKITHMKPPRRDRVADGLSQQTLNYQPSQRDTVV